MPSSLIPPPFQVSSSPSPPSPSTSPTSHLLPSRLKLLSLPKPELLHVQSQAVLLVLKVFSASLPNYLYNTSRTVVAYPSPLFFFSSRPSGEVSQSTTSVSTWVVLIYYDNDDHHYHLHSLDSSFVHVSRASLFLALVAFHMLYPEPKIAIIFISGERHPSRC